MKTKSMHKGLAVVLAVVMLLALVPLTSFATKASAAAATYVLNASDLDKADKPALDGKVLKAGTDSYFTIYGGPSTAVNENKGDFSTLDGFVGTKRLNMGDSKFDTPRDVVEFTTKGAASVKIWWKKNKADRQVAIYKPDGTAVATANEPDGDNSAHITTLNVESAGKYYLGNTPKGNYIFKVEVTEKGAAAADAKEFTFDANDLTQGDYAGKTEKSGTDGYFSVIFGGKGKVVAVGENDKFADGYAAKNKVNFDGKTTYANGDRLIEFTASKAGEAKVWWVSGGDNRSISLYSPDKGADVASAGKDSVKGTTYISKLKIDAPGKYYIGAPDGTNHFMKIVVTEGEVAEDPRAAWSTVAAPVIASAVQEKDADGKLTDNIIVTVNAAVGANGGDAVKVTMTDKDGKTTDKQSIGEKSSHELSFPASASGTYTFKAVLSRDGEADKAAAAISSVNFVLTLKKPTITSSTNKGDGKIELNWSEVKEAASYNVYRNGTKVGSSNTASYTDSGLTVGTKYTYTVAAVRGSEEGELSAEKTTTATKEAQSKWGYVVYGVSTNATDGSNGVSGDANEGSLTVFSEKGKGKIVSGGADGITFYYTAVPSNKNFTFRAKMHVDKWTYSNGQEAMGLMVSDSVPEMGTNPYWTNTYYLALGSVKYTWDSEYKEIDYSGAAGETLSRYDMRLGLGVVPKVGITPENWAKVGVDANITNKVDPGEQYTLETIAADKKLAAGRYNIAAGATNKDKAPTAAAELSDFDVEIQKNNTGYFFTYYDTKGNVVGKQKFYDPNALSALDKDNVYVGFFAARNARATFTDIKLTLTDPAKDAPAEQKPASVTRARLTLKGSAVANSSNYVAEASATVDGELVITIGGKEAGKSKMTAGAVALINVTLPASGANELTYTFTPASGAAAVTKKATVTLDTYLANQKNLYVAPNGNKYGNGTAAHPLDVQTAMNIAQPGQTIIVMEGTYKTESTLTVPRGNNGTKDKPIYMIADPNAKTRPVFDGQNKAGIVVQIAGDYWYVKGFDVTKSNASNGLRIAGNNCVADDISAYFNTGTGIAIQAYRNSDDPTNLWPQNNLILNCTSYNNADPGYEDADGFSAKLTVGEGNVFDGCVAYNNADDGWDLYARSSSGSIGAVTIKNSVAYANGYLLDGTNAGNGNGFKLGGENLAAGHKLINSLAFNNKAAGITSNSCPDVKVENCTSYNNEGANITLYTNIVTANTDYEVKGLISFKDNTVKSGLSNADSIKGQGTQVASKHNGDSNYYWNGSESANGKGAKVTADAFKSLTFKGSVARSADGSINLEGFTELTDKAPKGSGAVVKSAASANVTVTADTDVPNPRTGISPFAVIAVVLAGAGAAVCVFRRKRKV